MFENDESKAGSQTPVKPEDQERSQDTPTEQTPEEAEASFSKGFSDIAKDRLAPGGETSRSPEPKDDAKADEKAEKQELGEKPAAQQPQKTGEQGGKTDGGKPSGQEAPGDPHAPQDLALRKRLRKVEGIIGGLNDRVEGLVKTLDSQLKEVRQNAAKATSGADADKTTQQANAALERLKEIEASVGDFAELKPLVDELKTMRTDMEELRKARSQSAPPESQQSTDQRQQAPQFDPEELVERTTLNVKHPDWEAKTATAEFRQFMLTNGPSEEEYLKEYVPLVLNPAKAKDAERIVEGWKEDHPTWWAERGQYLFSNKAADSLRVLDEYEKVQQQQRQSQEQQQQKQSRKSSRLENALTPEGVSQEPPAGIDDGEAFARGFKKVAKKRQVGA